MALLGETIIAQAVGAESCLLSDPKYGMMRQIAANSGDCAAIIALVEALAAFQTILDS